MSRFNNRQTSKTTNKAGGDAYSKNPEEELAFAVLSTFLEDKFYESGDSRIERIITLIDKVDPSFVANLAIIARNEYHLRSINHLLIAELSKRDNTFIRETTIESIIRPDDITEIIAYLDGKLSNQLKRGLRRSLFKFDRYQLAKYRGKNKMVSLVDAFNLLHPNPKFADKEQKRAWKDLIEGNLKMIDTYETGIDKLPDLIKEGKIGYMALLRNLNNLTKYDADQVTIDKACEILSDPHRVRKSRQLPFRFYTAYANVLGSVQLTDAIIDAFELSIENMPKFEGKTFLGIDGSGSMEGRPMELASVIAASLIKSNDIDVVIYDTSLQDFTYSSRSMALDLARSINGRANGGGTNTGLVFEAAFNSGSDYDRIIIISDNESWDSRYGFDNVSEAYSLYRKNAKKDPYVYAIDVAGYGTHDVSSEKVFHFTGWSDRIFDFIDLAEQKNTLVKYIKNYERT